MARIKRQKIIVLFCHSCGLPKPFEDYDKSGVYFGKCGICGSEYQARQKAKGQNRYEVRISSACRLFCYILLLLL